MIKNLLILGVLVSAVACGRADVSGNRTLSTGPDPFSVLPSKPLEDPENYQSLPQPQPGVANRADINPISDATQALGGRGVAGAGVPAADAALLAHTGRRGVDSNIRAELAGERQSRLFGGSMALDAYAELERFRNAGVTTPSAPPAP